MKIPRLLALTAALALASVTPAVASPAERPAARTSGGYWMLTERGGVYNFGGAEKYGEPTSIPGRVKITATPSGNGYWVLSDSGSVYDYGDADTFGVASYLGLSERYTSMAATPDGKGYWLFTDKGRVFPFGNAQFYGDMAGVPLAGPVLDAVATADGKGYFMVASDGGLFTFGNARFIGSMGGRPLNKPVMSMAVDPDGAGYWLVASDGGIFAFEAPFYGSAGNLTLAKPISGMVASPTGKGYLMVAEDGGAFTYGDVPFYGSLGAQPPAYKVVSIAPIGPPPPPAVYEWKTVLEAVVVPGGQSQTSPFTVSGPINSVSYGCWWHSGTYSYGCHYTIYDYATGEYVEGWSTDALDSPASRITHLDPGTYYIEGDEFGPDTWWGVSVGDQQCVQNCL